MQDFELLIDVFMCMELNLCLELVAIYYSYVMVCVTGLYIVALLSFYSSSLNL